MKFGKIDALLALLLTVASLGWSAIAVSHATELSRYDEWTYIDYARKISEGHVPVRGEQLAPATRQDWACRGMEGKIRGVGLPPCERALDRDAKNFPFHGENYNAFHPPLYFLAAGYGGRAISTITGADFVDGARWVSALFVAGGVVVLFLAIRAWRVRRVAAFSGALLALTTPGIAASAAIVHNDAVTLLCGALAVWVGARIFVDHRLGWAFPALVTALTVATRAMSAAAIVTVTAVVAWAAIQPEVFGHERKDRRRLATVVVVNAAVTILAYEAWTVWQNARTPAGYVPAITGLSTVSLDEGGWGGLVASLPDAFGLTDPRSDFYLQPGLTSTPASLWAAALYLVYLAAPIALVVTWARKRHRALGAAVAAGPLASSFIVQAREVATNAAYFRKVSGRYAMSVVALTVAGIALLADRDKWRWVLCAAAIIGYACLSVGVLAG